jgi:hypothetical protein
MKDFRPQVLVGIIVLGVLAYLAMTYNYDILAGVLGGGIVATVTTLANNGNPPPAPPTP